MARINITIPDDLHEEIKKLAAAGAADSVSGFLADAARRSLDYARAARALDELFGPASPEEQALIARMRKPRRAGTSAA
ncbi:ribbon-helix-helix domain-containing protein [Nocardia sp. NPDC052566]|uniref:ribbon-helix-helix domain-containing protein n=1 Tax=Nocardia sp. NPDC052566 TaxID=3364330 RepID=UPI0037C9F00E